MASVKVAVRVRPFSQREIDMGAKLILKMDGKSTRITCPNRQSEKQTESYKCFTFDHSYWSFDDLDSHYASQKQVFDDLGTDVVDAAFEGYNACVFAYGQTGSGKTFTMMGSKGNEGLIPRICESLFKRMAQGANYRIEVSYLEIYNEKVKDLLRKDSGHNLKIRQHPTKGPCVMDLSRHLVSEYAHIKELMIRGNNQRTTASTNMNDVSSRSHAIFTLMFVQAQGGFSNDMPSETVSKVHLVDLAGSERADATGATGQRLKEGAHINKSLVTLGSVISALAELSSSTNNNNGSTRKNVFIPYRDSVLTWLLKDSLGGNSKTIMIAAVSPADCNYTETLSTLRYANRAKNIINKPTINEDENVKLIRDLREEIIKLKSLLSNDYTTEVQPQVLAALQEKEAQEKLLRQEWTDKWRETQKILQEQKALGLRKAGAGVVLDSDMPHLIGIDDDLLSTGVTLYHLKDGETKIGTEDANIKQDIILNGVSVEKEHCSILLSDGIATLIPQENAQCWVNGSQVDKPLRLSQGCNILLGRTNMFRYNDPVEVEKLKKEGNGSCCSSTLNLSRLSMMSWSTPDLATRSIENSPQKNVDENESSYNSNQLGKPQEFEIPLKGGSGDVNANIEVSVAENKEKELTEMCETFYSSVLTILRNQEENLKDKINQLNNDKITQSDFILEEKSILSKLQNLFLNDYELVKKQLKELNEASDSENHSETYFKLKKMIACYEDDVSVKMKLISERERNLKEVNDQLEETEDDLNKVKNLLRNSCSDSWSRISAERRKSLNLSLPSLNPIATSSPKKYDHQCSSNSALPSPSSTSELRMDDAEESDVSSVDLSYRKRHLKRNSEINQKRMLQVRPSSLIFERLAVRNLEVTNKMKHLMQQITRQRMLIMRCLETDIDSDQINKHISILQEMKREYVKLEQNLQEGCKENLDVQPVVSVNIEDSDDLSTSAEEMISESTYEDQNRYVSSQFLDYNHELSRSAQDISLRILQDRLQISMKSPLSIYNQQLDQACNYNRAISMPSLSRLSAWDVSLSGVSNRTENSELTVTVPNFLLRGARRNTHFVYEVRVKVQGEAYTILRRYRRFRELHLTMKHKYKDAVSKLSFPPRRLFNWNGDAEWVAKERRPQLELYLQKLFKTCSEIETCPLYKNSTKAALHTFSPFFKRGIFETGKFGTS